MEISGALHVGGAPSNMVEAERMARRMLLTFVFLFFFVFLDGLCRKGPLLSGLLFVNFA